MNREEVRLSHPMLRLPLHARVRGSCGVRRGPLTSAFRGNPDDIAHTEFFSLWPGSERLAVSTTGPEYAG
jgi:hypothetical protein